MLKLKLFTGHLPIVPSEWQDALGLERHQLVVAHFHYEPGPQGRGIYIEKLER